MKRLLFLTLLCLTTFGAFPRYVGDVNADGTISIADVTTLVNIILGKNETNKVADVNQDEQVTIADVTTLVNIILGKPLNNDVEITDTDDNGYVDYGGGGSGSARVKEQGSSNAWSDDWDK